MVPSRNLCAPYDSAQSFPGIRRKVIFFEMGLKESGTKFEAVVSTASRFAVLAKFSIALQ